MECDFCKKKFKNKYSLSTHQTTTKSCLLIQGKMQDEEILKYKCNFCDKKFSLNQSLEKHENICKAKKQEEQEIISQQLKEYKKLKLKIKQDKQYEKIIHQLTTENVEIKCENNLQKEIIENLKQTIIKLESKIEKYENNTSNLINQIQNDKMVMFKETTSLLNKPFITNQTLVSNVKNNFNIAISKLVPFTKENVIDRFNKLTVAMFRLEIKNFCKQIAELFSDMCITTDISRQIVSVKLEDGSIQKFTSKKFIEKAINLYDIKKLEEKYHEAVLLSQEYIEKLEIEIQCQIQIYWTVILGAIRCYKEGTESKLIALTSTEIANKCYSKETSNLISSYINSSNQENLNIPLINLINEPFEVL
jgi:hypothetical protein